MSDPTQPDAGTAPMPDDERGISEWTPEELIAACVEAQKQLHLANSETAKIRIERNEWKCSARLYHSELRDLAAGKKVETQLGFPVEKLIRETTAERDSALARLKEAESQLVAFKAALDFCFIERDEARAVVVYWKDQWNKQTNDRDRLSAEIAALRKDKEEAEAQLSKADREIERLTIVNTALDTSDETILLDWIEKGTNADLLHRDATVIKGFFIEGYGMETRPTLRSAIRAALASQPIPGSLTPGLDTPFVSEPSNSAAKCPVCGESSALGECCEDAPSPTSEGSKP